MKQITTILIGIALSFAMSWASYAQGGYEVKGMVLDETGPMVGATVLERGTTNGTSTGADGDYILKVSGPTAVVEISSIGYKTVSFIASQLPASIILQLDTEMLEETVVVGYGSLSKKEISSSVVSVGAEDFNKAAAGDPMQLLVGKVAGLNIDVSADGKSSSFQIRGATSINGGNSPLVVIDGVAGASLSDVSTQDIESISVLKDGASAAIYGTRGANGVVLVTTKKGAGAAGKVRVTYDSYFAIQALHKMPDVYGLDEWLTMNQETGRNKTDYGGREEKAYWKALRNDKPTYDLNQHITFAGSTAKSNYNLSLNYTRNNQLYKNNEREAYRARFVMNQKFFNDIVELTTNASVRANLNRGNSGSLVGAWFMNPTRPVYDETTPTGYFWPTHSTGATNSVENNQLPTNKSHNLSINWQEDLKVTLFKNLNHQLTTNAAISAGYRSTNEYSYTPSIMQTCQMWNDYAGSATIKNSHSLNMNFEWMVNYNMSIKKHNLKAVAGYSYTQYDGESHNMTNKDFQYDQFLWYNMASGTYLGKGLASMGSSKTFNKLAGVFGRVTYSWNDLITATASLRYEGSSKFGKNRKYGYFPAVSAAWTISNMGFMDSTKSWLDNLRIRASYGVTGRNAGDDYASLATYSSKGSNYFMDGEWVGGYGITRNSNPNLGWETAVVYDYGVDFELFNRRFTGSIEYFDRRSENLLYTYTAPQPPYVYSTIQLNLGSTQNRGVEIALNWSDKIGKNWSYSVGGTYSYSDAFLRSIGNDVYAASYVDLGSLGTLGSSEYRFRLEEGTRIGTLRGYKYAGYNEEGQILHYTADGGTASKTSCVDDDKVVIGNTLPKHSFSIYLSLRYKQWNLTINGRGLAGMDIWNSQLQTYGLPGSTSDNLLRSAYTKYAHLTADNDYLNSFYLEKGDWFKLEKVSVGRDFKFKQNKAGFESLNIYLAATNLFTLTGFTGVDPSTVSSVGLTPGIASTANLYTSTITLGISARF
ncbi:MAG: SusC/RagA family TonB-linked outer membrane protein [Bacteroidales bacterium]|nr:SusC/RagA family TonB-linked outer membrane protein [Bacteroidales bacterium]